MKAFLFELYACLTFDLFHTTKKKKKIIFKQLIASRNTLTDSQSLFDNFTKVYHRFFIKYPSMSEKGKKFTWARIICPASSFSHWHFERQHLELEFVLTLHEDVNLDWDASSEFSF